MPRQRIRSQILESMFGITLLRTQRHHRIMYTLAYASDSALSTHSSDEFSNDDSSHDGSHSDSLSSASSVSSASSASSSVSSMSLSSSSISDSSASSSSHTASSTLSTSSSDDLSTEEVQQLRRWFLRSLATLAAFVDFIKTSRVLFPNEVRKQSQLPLVLSYYKYHDHRRFRRNLRVAPASFDRLLSMIQDHDIFQNNSQNPQAPVLFQLAIALRRFGHNGSASGNEEIGQWAGCSAGFVTLCTRRVMQAFLSLHDMAIRWPSAAEKRKAADWVEAHSCAGWRPGFAMVDGTLVPLFSKPANYGSQFYDRKCNYSLNVQLVTLPNLRIIDYVLGQTGSMHDSEAFKLSYTYAHHAELFPNGQWLWADTAYGVTDWCVSPYKRPAALIIPNKHFNFHVSRIRIRSEHAVGALKGRFQSLKFLRQNIHSREDHKMALEWVRTCLILHNLLLDLEPASDDMHEWEWFLEDAAIPAELDEIFLWDRQPPRIVGGDVKRQMVQEILFDQVYT